MSDLYGKVELDEASLIEFSQQIREEIIQEIIEKGMKSHEIVEWLQSINQEKYYDILVETIAIQATKDRESSFDRAIQAQRKLQVIQSIINL